MSLRSGNGAKQRLAGWIKQVFSNWPIQSELISRQTKPARAVAVSITSLPAATSTTEPPHPGHETQGVMTRRFSTTWQIPKSFNSQTPGNNPQHAVCVRLTDRCTSH